MSGSGKRRAVIIGGSLGGLLVAHQLRIIGWDVDVFERSKGDLADRGAGISTHHAVFHAVERAGLTIDTSSRIVPRDYLCLDQRNRLIHTHPAWRTMTTWSRLYRPLRDSLPAANYHEDMPLVSVATDARGATARFADGSSVAADLVIGADGFRSTVRGQILPNINPAYAGYVAWRALLPESEIPPDTWAKIRDDYIFCVPEGELLVSYTVPTRDEDQHKGRLSYNIVWYRPANTAALRDLCTDAHGRHHEISIPPALVRRDVIAAMKSDARRLLSPWIADVIERTAQPFLQPIYDLISPRVVVDRVALVGDAAFVARPHVGAGVSKAALDAMRLADAIATADGDVNAALASYETGCRQFGNWCVERGRHMGSRIKLRGADEDQPSEAELDRRAIQSVEDYVEIAKAIETRTGVREA
jgi:2-polyprenyl-6-methoxyphenol hydroxylase-like FAD-dependent oxidoreductase